jgi:hypothetical protein
MFIARYSENIQEDIKRNWSSWNFGQLGFEGTEEELKEKMQNAINEETSFDISGFELWGNDILNADIRELYAGYWVLVDNVNTPEGLSCIDLDASNLEEAITEAKSKDYTGDGQSFDANDAVLVHSDGEIHIFEIKD